MLPTEAARVKAGAWLRQQGFGCDDAAFHIAPHYGLDERDDALASRIEANRPQHIIIAIGGGPQEKLALGLRNALSYRPAIHCIGAALGFLTGDQVAIPR